jgi:hypothetical protein
MLGDVAAVIAAIGSIGTAVAVIVGFHQLKQAERQAMVRFEDDLSREYRSILKDIPVEALYVDGDVELNEETLRAFYRYFDLSNEQLFQGNEGRVRAATFEQWRDGIKGNLELPVFRQAWRATAARIPSNFLEDLRDIAPLERA